MTKGKNILSRGENTHLAGSKILELQVVNPLEGKFFFASYMLLMSSFLVVDAKGGEVVGTKAMKCYQTPNTTKLIFSSFKWFWLFGQKYEASELWT